MMLIPDSRRRVTLPAEFPAGEPINIEPLEDGTYRLIPMVAIPAHQLWAWRSDRQASIEKALEEHHKGEGVELSSPEGQAFLRSLDRK